MKKIFFNIIFILNLVIFIPNYALSYSFNKENITKNILVETIKNSNNFDSPPNINARHAVIIDRNSNSILYGKKENEKCKMASTTKIMTALVVIENLNLTNKVIISKSAAKIGGSRLGLSSNDTITVHDLLYGLLLCSGNDAAIALAESVARIS